MKEDCTLYRTIDFVGKKWTLLILLEIYKGNGKRYTEVKKSIPRITPKILSARLKELEGEGLIIKETDARTFPVKSEYSLTRSGKDFVEIVKEMKQWGLKWKVKNKNCEFSDCGDCKL